MDFFEKNLVEPLTLAAVIAFIAGLVGTKVFDYFWAIFVGEPTRFIASRFWAIRNLYWLGQGNSDFSGLWKVEWHTDAKSYPSVNIGYSNLFRLGNNLAIEVQFEDSKGQKNSYRFVGQMAKQKVTGKWFDVGRPEAGYFGTFQLEIRVALTGADGQWLGYSDKEGVRCGKMIWEKDAPSSSMLHRLSA